MIRQATISPCGLYRFHLARIWPDHQHRPRLFVCMLNPSRANAHHDDPTILNLIHFAQAWGFGGIEVINLRAWRTSSPRSLFAAEADGLDTRGAFNDQMWARAASYARCNNQPILVAWGNNAPAADVAAFESATDGIELICLGRTSLGAPIHPSARGKLRIPRDRQPISFRSGVAS